MAWHCFRLDLNPGHDSQSMLEYREGVIEQPVWPVDPVLNMYMSPIATSLHTSY